MRGLPRHGLIHTIRVTCGLHIHIAQCRGGGTMVSRLGDSASDGTILGMVVISVIMILGIVLITADITDIAIHITGITGTTILIME